jgi:hypothetical protein
MFAVDTSFASFGPRLGPFRSSVEWKVARRALLKEHERKTLLDIPIDEDSLIRYYSLAPADLLEI